MLLLRSSVAHERLQHRRQTKQPQSDWVRRTGIAGEMQGAKDTSRGRKSGSLIRRALFACVLLMGFRYFESFPGMAPVQEVWNVLCFVVVLIGYPILKFRRGWTDFWFEAYVLLLVTADVVLSAWRADAVFGQPLIYGALSQRHIVLTASLLFLVFAFRRRMIRLSDIEAVLVFLSWATLLINIAIELFLNPADFAGRSFGFVAGDHFTLPSLLIIFGVLYYALRGIRTRRAKFYAAALVLFASALGPSGRGMTIAVAITLTYFLFRLRGAKRGAVAVFKFGCFGAVLLGSLFILFPQALSQRLGLYSDAFSVVLTGTLSEDASANARVFETLAALPYILKHPLLGCGSLSNRWNGGAMSTIGEYFYTDDIGLVGVVFSYGVFGLFLFFFQFFFAWRAAQKVPASLKSPLLDATKAFILFCGLWSIETGLCVWSPEMTLFFIILLAGIAIGSKPKRSSVALKEKEWGPAT